MPHSSKMRQWFSHFVLDWPVRTKSHVCGCFEIMPMTLNVKRTGASGCLWPVTRLLFFFGCVWQAGQTPVLFGQKNSVTITLPRWQQHAPNKVFKRPLLIYNRFVQGLIYGFWRRPVCKIIRDYQMDFEKCNKSINYLDYPNRGRIWTFITLQTIASRCGHGIAWHMLPILTSGKAH